MYCIYFFTFSLKCNVCYLFASLLWNFKFLKFINFIGFKHFTFYLVLSIAFGELEGILFFKHHFIFLPILHV